MNYNMLCAKYPQGQGNNTLFNYFASFSNEQWLLYESDFHKIFKISAFSIILIYFFYLCI